MEKSSEHGVKEQGDALESGVPPFPVFSKLNPVRMDEEAGFILADKPTGKSSFWVVKRFRHDWKLKKVGHAGTLDPAASGLMVLAFGKATKAIESIQNQTKEYEAVVRFGQTTPSLDAETPVSAESPFDHVTLQGLIQTIQSRFVGDVIQVPPMYSALQVDGQRLYDLARKGQEVERKQRTIHIYSIDVLDFSLPDVHIRVSCSKGTYIRTLAGDLGEAMGTKAFLAALRRTKTGVFDVNNALPVPLHIPTV
jgi:tRNA pseudouridine55 synthase